MLEKHSVSIRGHRTSFSVEEEFWLEIQSIAGERGQSVARLVSEIDEKRAAGENLSSAIRVFVIRHLKSKNTD